MSRFPGRIGDGAAANGARSSARPHSFPMERAFPLDSRSMESAGYDDETIGWATGFSRSAPGIGRVPARSRACASAVRQAAVSPLA